jgi:hypothetical protein
MRPDHENVPDADVTELKIESVGIHPPRRYAI